MNSQPRKAGAYDEFNKILLDRRSVLQNEIAGGLRAIDLESGSNITGQVHDLKDDSLADMLVDARLADLHRDIQELRDVEAALQRIQNGSYGVCVEGGEGIPLARLKAYPTAKRCLPCQEAYEKKHPIEGRMRAG